MSKKNRNVVANQPPVEDTPQQPPKIVTDAFAVKTRAENWCDSHPRLTKAFRFTEHVLAGVGIIAIAGVVKEALSPSTVVSDDDDAEVFEAYSEEDEDGDEDED